MKELVVVIRPSFMKFCQDACRAALLNHILFWISWNAKDKSQKAILSGEITYYATNEELIECMAGAWSDKKVRSEVNALIDLGVIGKTKNQKFGADRTKHFYFAKEQYAKLIELCKQHAICLAHIGLPKEIINFLAAFDQSIECPCTKQTVNLPNANGKSTECSELKQTVNLPNANGKSTGAITKITTKITTKGIKSHDATENITGLEPKDSSPTFSSSRITTQSEPREKQKDVPHKEPTPIEQVYQDYDHALQETQIVDASYRTSRDPSNDREMKKLLDQGATYQKLVRVLKCLRDDKDPFYRKNINPGFIAKHYAARVGREVASTAPQVSSQLEELRSIMDKYVK